jgi:hypothetical protein
MDGFYNRSRKVHGKFATIANRISTFERNDVSNCKMNAPIMRIIALLILLFITKVAVSQEAPEFTFPRSLVKLSPLQLFNNTLELGVETFNSKLSKSFQVTAGFKSGSADFDDGQGASLELAFRKYVLPMELRVRKSREFYQGIYYSLYVGGAYFEGKASSYGYYDPNTNTWINGSYSATIKSISPGFTIGLQKTLWKVLVLDVFIGGGIKFSESHYSGTNYYPEYSGILDPGYDGIYPKFGGKIAVGL